MQQLIQLRWIAVVGQITTISIASLVSIGAADGADAQCAGLPDCLQYRQHLRWQENQVVSNGELLLALLVDVASLTAQLYLSGGATNPFVFLYLQGDPGAVLLERWSTWVIVGVTGAVCRSGPVLPAAAAAARPCQWHLQPVRRACCLLRARRGAAGGVHYPYHRQCAPARPSWPTCANVRPKKTSSYGLAGFRRRARTGHAAGHAGRDPGRLEAYARVQEQSRTAGRRGEMQTQLKRCKSIVSGILLSAGEARGESSAATTIHLPRRDGGRVAHGRPVVQFIFDKRIAPISRGVRFHAQADDLQCAR
jgi:two-component system sensor histidine kinase RegB